MTEPARGSREWSARATLRVALVVLAAASATSVVGVWMHRASGGPTATELWGTGLGAAALVVTLFGLRAVDHELHARLRVSRDLLTAERQHAAILDIAADAIITVDADHVVVNYNHGAEEIFGWQRAEVTGRPLSVLLPERFREAHEGHIAHFAQSPRAARRMGERQEIFGLRRDGSEFLAEASISRVEVGGRRLFTVVLRDVTSRRQQEDDSRFLARAGATLGTSLDYESALLSVVHLAVPYLADCCVLDVQEEGVGMRRVASVHDDPDLTKHLRALAAWPLERGDWPFPVSAAMARGAAVQQGGLAPGWAREHGPGDGREALVEALGIRSLVTVPLNARGRTIGALTFLATGVARDYGEDREAVLLSLAKLVAFALDNAWLYRAAQRASRARDEILGVVSHDLRNPLSAVSMCARQLLLPDRARDDGQAGLAGTILEAAELMNRLISDLQDVAVIESGNLTVHRNPERLLPVVERVLSMMGEAARERDVSLSASVPDGTPPVDADEGRLAQVLANLAGNAIKFTEGGGTVSIVVTSGDRDVTIAVRDTGHGIAAEDLPHIFDRYWQARRKSRTAGSGLGLAIARGIVEAHGGRLWVESALEQGSTFYFTIPVASDGQFPPV